MKLNFKNLLFSFISISVFSSCNQLEDNVNPHREEISLVQTAQVTLPLPTPTLIASSNSKGIGLNWVDSSELIFGCKVVFLGASTTEGVGASTPANCYVSKVKQGLESVYKNQVIINLGVSGYNSYYLQPTGSAVVTGRPAPDTKHNITAALSYNPNIIVVSLPSNDITSGFTDEEYLNNLQTIYNTGKNAGVKIFMCTTNPKDNVTYRDRLKALSKTILQKFGSDAIDTHTPLALSDNSINPIYNSDGTHLNDAGHLVMANTVLPFLKRFITTTRVAKEYILESSPATDGKFSVIKTLTVSDSTYIDTIPGILAKRYYRLKSSNGTTESDYSKVVCGAKCTSFNPLTDLPGLQVYINPSDLTQANGAAIASLVERSPNGYSLTYKGSTPAVLVENGINGKKVLRFNNNGYSLSSNSLNMERNMGGGTVYAVTKRVTTTAAHWIFRVMNNSTKTRFGLGTSATNVEGLGGRRLDGDGYEENKNTAKNNTWKIESGYVNYEEKTATYSVNGTLVQSNSNFQSAGKTSDTNSTDIRVMDGAIGDLAFLVVCNEVHDQKTIDNMENYLNSLFSIY